MKELIKLKNNILNIVSNDLDKDLLISIIEEKIESEISAKDVANYFLNKAKENNTYLNNWYLQSLVYLANGIRIGAYNKPLFNEDVYAWDFGPVVRDLYNKLMKYGNGFVTEFIDINNGSNIFKKDAITCMDKAWEIFYIQYVKDYKDEALNNVNHMITKKGSPWYLTFIEENKKYHVININLISRGFGKWIKMKY